MISEQIIYNYLEITDITKEIENIVEFCLESACDYICRYCNVDKSKVIRNKTLSVVMLRITYTLYHNRDLILDTFDVLDGLTKSMLDINKQYSI